MKVTKQLNGTFDCETVDGNKFICSDIRGGIVWPVISGNVPAYYCILGEEWTKWTKYKGQEAQRGKLRFFSELEADISQPLNNFFAKLTDDTYRYHCSTLYGITEEYQSKDRNAYTRMLNRFIDEKDIALRLERAPWAEEPESGIVYVNKWIHKGLLDIPEGSLLIEQLRCPKKEGVSVEELLVCLNAVKALRFVVCGFEKNKPLKPSKNWRGADLGSWKSL